MNITKTGWRGEEIELSLCEVAVAEIEGSPDYGSGQLEELKYKHGRGSEILGRLIETLADKDLLTKDELELIIYGYNNGQITDTF